MALKDILEKIEKDNEAEIALIKKEAKEKCDGINKETEQIIKEIREKNRHAANLKSEKLKEKILQDARLKMAKEILIKKSEVISSVFKETLDALENLSVKEYIEWVGEKMSEVIEPGENEIILPQHFLAKINVKEFFKNINEGLGGKSRVKLSKSSQELKSGFILKKQKKEVNCSFQSLLEEKRNDIKLKISQVLFKNL